MSHADSRPSAAQGGDRQGTKVTSNVNFPQGQARAPNVKSNLWQMMWSGTA